VSERRVETERRIVETDEEFVGAEEYDVSSGDDNACQRFIDIQEIGSEKSARESPDPASSVLDCKVSLRQLLSPPQITSLEALDTIVFDFEYFYYIGKACCMAESFEYMGIQCFTLFLNDCEPDNIRYHKAHLFLAFLHL